MLRHLFAPLVKIGEGHAALGWFIGTTPGGEQRIFTRGSDELGSSSLLYAYPQSDTMIVVLSRAGSKDEEMSWSRAVHARMEALLFRTQPSASNALSCRHVCRRRQLLGHRQRR